MGETRTIDCGCVITVWPSWDEPDSWVIRPCDECKTEMVRRLTADLEGAP